MNFRNIEQKINSTKFVLEENRFFTSTKFLFFGHMPARSTGIIKSKQSLFNNNIHALIGM